MNVHFIFLGESWQYEHNHNRISGSTQSWSGGRTKRWRTQQVYKTKSYRYVSAFDNDIVNKQLVIVIPFLFTEIIEENDEEISLTSVFQKMVELEMEDLPSGGGIYSKWVWKKYRKKSQNY